MDDCITHHEATPVERAIASVERRIMRVQIVALAKLILLHLVLFLLPDIPAVFHYVVTSITILFFMQFIGFVAVYWGEDLVATMKAKNWFFAGSRCAPVLPCKPAAPQSAAFERGVDLPGTDPSSLIGADETAYAAVRTTTVYQLKNRGDIGDQRVFVRMPVGVDVARIVAFLQFTAQGWAGPAAFVSNLGIAAALVAFFGGKPGARDDSAEVIEMHQVCQAHASQVQGLLMSAGLHRAGLHEALMPHVEG